jgi:hypothetical protein
MAKESQLERPAAARSTQMECRNLSNKSLFHDAPPMFISPLTTTSLAVLRSAARGSRRGCGTVVSLENEGT